MSSSSGQSVEELQRQLQEEVKLRTEIAKKSQKLLQSKKQLKDDYAQVVAERNALQLQLASPDKSDIVKRLQERVALLERARSDDLELTEFDSDNLAKRVQQLTTQNERLQIQLEEARQSGEKPGILVGKPNPNEIHYVISLKDAEDMTKRIKKLQSELWNLEIKHQQLQEVHSRCSIVPTSLDMSSEEISQLKDAIKKEKDVNMLLQARYKDLNEAVLALKDHVAEKLAKDPDNRLLQTVMAVTKKALPPSPATLAAETYQPRASRAISGPSRGSEDKGDSGSRSSGKDPLKSVKDKEKREDRKSKVRVTIGQ